VMLVTSILALMRHSSLADENPSMTVAATAASPSPAGAFFFPIPVLLGPPRAGTVNPGRGPSDSMGRVYTVKPGKASTGTRTAAAKSVFLGTPADLEKANEYAVRVLDVVGTNAWPGDHWKTATVAEAFLMQKNYPRAAETYRTAIAIAPKETGSHATSWTQASRLMAQLDATADEQALINRAFQHLPKP
jgi:hypothetical protein